MQRLVHLHPGFGSDGARGMRYFFEVVGDHHAGLAVQCKRLDFACSVKPRIAENLSLPVSRQIANVGAAGRRLLKYPPMLQALFFDLRDRSKLHGLGCLFYRFLTRILLLFDHDFLTALAETVDSTFIRADVKRAIGSSETEGVAVNAG